MLLPCPRSLKLLRGTFTLPKRNLLAAIKVVRRHSALNHPNRRRAGSALGRVAKAEGYTLTISKS